jgi:hypothetical protein
MLRAAGYLREQWSGVSSAGTSLEPHQTFTLELGAVVVLTALGVGVQVGGWPLWSLFFAAAGYVCWVVMYSEATIQASRLRFHRRARRRKLAA